MRLSFYLNNARWLSTGLVLTFGSSFGQTWFISLFSGGIRAEYGLSDGQWGGIFMLATLASAAVLVQAGRLADTLPLRRLMMMVISLFALAALGMALGQSVLLLAICVFGLRLCGQGMMGHLASVAMARWFRANRGRAIALSTIGFSLGLAILPPIMVWLMYRLEWREVWLVTAAVLMVLFLPVLTYLMSGHREPAGEGPDTAAAGLRGMHWKRRDVMGHGAFWLIVLGMLASPFIGTVTFFHQIHIAEIRGWDLAPMAIGYTVFSVVTVISSLLTGTVIDRMGPMRVLPLYLLPMAAAMMLIAVPGNVWIWTLTLAALGVATGMGSTLFGTLWPTLYGTNHIGAIKAMAGSIMVFATAAGPGLTGWLIDLGVSFPEQGPWLAAWCILVSAAFAVLGPRLHRQISAL